MRVIAIVTAGVLAAGAAAARDWSIAAPRWSDPASGAAAAEPQTWRLVDSRWGFVAALSYGLADALEACPGGDPALVASLRMTPHRYTTKTAEAVAAYRACEPKAFAAGSAPGVVPASTWRALSGLAADPDPIERAKPIVFATAFPTYDYDRTAWELGGGAGVDPGRVFTWGPWRATAGYGCTVQKVLRDLYGPSHTRALVDAAFEDDPALLRTLLAHASGGCAQAAAQLRPVYADPDRQGALQARFGQLAENAAVRAAYDRFFLGPRGYLSARVAKYAAIYDQAGLTPTEADWGWFLQSALNYPPIDDMLAATLAGLLKAEPPADNAAARRKLSLALPYKRPEARLLNLGRDAAFWVDRTGEAGLTPEERAAWIAHSRLRASDVGLSDRPWRPGCDRLWLDACGPRS